MLNPETATNLSKSSQEEGNGRIILIYSILSIPSTPRLRHRAPVGADGEWVELDGLATVGTGDFLAEGGGGVFGPGAAEGAAEGRPNIGL